ncbi:hypothetical protein NX773_02375 [Massilia solisilvae]|uniref:Uncharacterized protein n=1 Tax=Massilia solisilvae TaxID=1811225 RepID=A0ABT2BER5_9BURK|nr:hypothetical protein [Massilia solisilvae]MCS0607009.1 hypothetical protein [Massilia solisilvae]
MTTAHENHRGKRMGNRCLFPEIKHLQRFLTETCEAGNARVGQLGGRKFSRRNSAVSVPFRLIFAPLLLAHVWLTYPELGPHVPVALAEWQIDLYGSHNGDDLADLEDLFAFAVSFLLIAILTAAALVARQRYSINRAMQEGGR